MLDSDGRDKAAEIALRIQALRVVHLENMLGRYYQQHKIKGAHCICELCRGTKQLLAAGLLGQSVDRQPDWLKTIME